MLTAFLLVVALAPTGQAQSPQVQSSQELTTLVERVVRLADLQNRKLDVDQKLAAARRTVAENHPTMLTLLSELAEVESAIRRENLEAHQSDAKLLAERRAGLEYEIAALQKSLGEAHPSRRLAETKLAAIKEQQRSAAVAALAAGGEVELRASITRQPTTVGPYLELAGLYVLAGRGDDAAQLLTDALAVLKRSGG